VFIAERSTRSHGKENLMLNFLREGGAPMLLIVVFGILGIMAGGAFAYRPDPRKVEAVRSLNMALLFFTLAGVASDLAAVMHHVPARPEWAHSPDLHLIVMTGLGESMAPAILGFSVLAVIWLLMTLGFRRLARQM
jgi:hypothetical protein